MHYSFLHKFSPRLYIHSVDLLIERLTQINKKFSRNNFVLQNLLYLCNIKLILKLKRL